MSDEKTRDQRDVKKDVEAEPSKDRQPRRERTYWTVDADNPLICRGID